MFRNDHSIFPSILLNDVPLTTFDHSKLGRSKWFNSLSTGALPINSSSIRMPKHPRPGSCPLPTYIIDKSGYQGDLGELNGEFSHQPLFPLESSPPVELIQRPDKNILSSSGKRISQPVNLSPLKITDEISDPSEPHWIVHRRHRKHKRNRGPKKRNTDKFSLVGQRVDPGGKVVRRHNTMRFGTVKSINWKINKPHRSGVIVYTVFEGTLLFGLGIDLIYDNITDFGGQVSYTEDRNAVVGGLREYHEETHGIFGKFSPEQVEDCKVALRNDMMVIFIPLEIYPEKASIQFLKEAKLSTEREIKELIWLNKKDLIKLITQGHIVKNRFGEKPKRIEIYNLLGDFMSQLHNTFHDFTLEL
uniref:NUDIX hydrolase n=1 Tax=Pithovirus LCPAC201 TaxID=2506591 RepID=A0A481Z5Z5_9VIRU|nr:MAG: NUDIX hydrolase [Pithovirus LCPAC201]